MCIRDRSSIVTQVIVDSHPQSLDYDDVNSASAWQTSTLSGYLNSNARFYSNGNFPFDSYAVWVVDLPRAGKWAIDAYCRDNITFAQGAQYRFVDSTGAVRSTVATQRSATDSATTGNWFVNADGVTDPSAYTFNAGRVYVTIYGNTTGSQTVVADALRFRYIGSAVDDWALY